MASGNKHRNFEGLSEGIYSQLAEIEKLIDSCRIEEEIPSLAEFQEAIHNEAGASEGGSSYELYIPKLSAFLKSVEHIPIVQQKQKKSRELNQTSIYSRREDLENSTLTLNNQSKIAESDAVTTSEDFKSSKIQYINFTQKIGKNDEGINRCHTEINKLNKFISHLEELLPSTERDAPPLLSHQQEAQIKRLDETMQDLIYIRKNENAYPKINDQSSIAQQLEAVVPVINEILQNVNINI